MGTIIWRDPPPIQRDRSLWKRLQALMAEPGRWAVLGEYSSIQSATATASCLRNRGARPEGDFQFTSRSLPSGRAELYGRYAPEELNLTR